MSMPGAESWPHGLLLVDKPAGTTSRRIVERIQKALAPPGPRRRRGGPRFRCGHAGTLDPLATGLLIVLVGAGTRLSHYLLGHDKTYLATLVFGATTDTLDADGTIVARGPVDFDLTAIDAAIAARRGLQDQVPPMISAIKVQGRPLFRRVRDGEAVAPPAARSVRIHALDRRSAITIDPVDSSLVRVEIEVRCSSGTYIRSLARDLGADLGTCAHVAALRRLDIGQFDVGAGLADHELDDPEAILKALKPLADALPETPSLELTDGEAASLRLGVQPSPEWLARLERKPVSLADQRDRLWRMVDSHGMLVALGRMEPDPDVPGEERPRSAIVFPALPEADQEGDSCS